MVGCEVGGAVKNVLAIAAGIGDGLGFGWNTKAALITRGLAELTRLGVALGGTPLTFLGLAGNGDLIATCSSPQPQPSSSARSSAGVGHSGRSSTGCGWWRRAGTTPGVLGLARRLGVDMPISEKVGAVLAGELSAADVVHLLMRRRQARARRSLRDNPTFGTRLLVLVDASPLSPQYGARRSRLSTFSAPDSGSGSVELERLGHLEGRDPLAGVRLELVFGRGGVGVEHDDGVDRLTPDVMRDPDDGDLRDRRMRGKRSRPRPSTRSRRR